MTAPTGKSPHDDETNDWRSWIVENGPRLLLCARQYTRGAADAEDALQEALVRYWKHQRHLPGDRNALILTSLRRAAIDKARSHDRRVNREQAHLVIEGDPIEWFNPEPDEREKVVEAAIKLLPHEQREVVTLKIWGDLTFDEIGKQLEISPNTVSSRYRYALAALKKHLAGIRSELSP
jgi:RNA polymerase sigma-70 factor (ECF subfamily)